MKNLLFAALIALLAGESYGQAVTPTYPTPNANAIAIAAQYPQASSTGVPAINVPLFNLSCAGSQFPLTLSYNTNGVKPNVQGSWIGLGWNLSAGGSITRVVNDKEDDVDWWAMDDYTWITNSKAIGYYYNHGYLNVSDWASSEMIGDALTDIDNYSYNVADHPRGNTIKDYSADEFAFSVGNISGSFYMGHDGVWKVRSSTKVKVEVSNSDFAYISVPLGYPDRRYLKRITLVDTQGIRYVFGGDDSALEWTDRACRVWYLTAINFPNGKSINYTYSAGQRVEFKQVFAYDLSSFSVSVVNDIQNPVYLSGITTDEQSFQFYRSESANAYAQLDSILIKNRIDFKPLETIVFIHGNTPMDRLRLTEVYHRNPANQAFNAYSMSYNSEDLNHITNFLVYKNTDHWGYNSTISLDPTSANAFYASKRADTAHCRAELLEQITYPTGGYTKYTWEPHDYSKMVPDNRSDSLITYPATQYAGGVRIKQVTNYDQDNTVIGKKRYSYLSNYPSGSSTTSSGILAAKPITDYRSSTYFVFASIMPLLRNNVGGHISYSEVTEINADNSYTTTTFSNFDNGTANEYMDEASSNDVEDGFSTTSPEYISNSHERGFPLTEQSYSSTGTLVKQKTTEYERIDKANEYTRSYVGSAFRDYSGGSSYIAYHGSAIKIYTNAYLPHVVTETTYDVSGLNPVTTVTTLTNDTRRQVTRSSTANSKGQTIAADYKYPYDFTGTPVYASMTDRNMISAPIEQKNFNLAVSTTVPRSSQLNSYAYFNSDTNQIYPSLIQTQKEAAGYETVQEFFRYDNEGNVLCVSERGGPKTSYIYSYDGSYPVAEIRNADYTDIETALGTSAISTFRNKKQLTNQGIRAFLAPVATAIADSRISCYTYRPLVGILTSSDIRNQMTSYEYDNRNRLSTVWDHLGNIVKRYCYNYAGQPEGCPMIGTGSVTAASPAFYARLELLDPTIDNPASNWDYRYADLYIRFYTDASCTTPYTTANNIKIRYRQHFSYTAADDLTGSSTDTDYDFDVPTGSSSILISNVETSGYEEAGTDPDLGTLWYQEYYTYSLLSTGSPSQPYAVYTEKPTYIQP
jgi:hypothetical protein